MEESSSWINAFLEIEQRDILYDVAILQAGAGHNNASSRVILSGTVTSEFICEQTRNEFAQPYPFLGIVIWRRADDELIVRKLGHAWTWIDISLRI